jgi:hypothetical protein
VTSVSGTGTVNGITLSGTVSTSGNLTLGGSLTDVVFLSGSQTITGQKTFTGSILVSVIGLSGSNPNVITFDSGATNNIGSSGIPASNIYSSFFGVSSASTGIARQSGQETLQVNANGAARYYGSDGGWFPAADNVYVVGAPSNRWSAVWAANGSIQTSDERQKTDIQNTSLGLSFINALRPVSYKWVVGGNEVQNRYTEEERDAFLAQDHTLPDDYFDPIVTPRAGRRTHYGLIAQEVKDVLGTTDFGGYVYDAETDQHALRYDQFVAPLIKAVQELSAKVQELEARLNGG